MPAVWTDDPTIGNALAGVANAAYSGPMVQLKVMETMAGLRQRALEYQKLQQQLSLAKQAGDQASSIFDDTGGGLLGGNAGPIPSASPAGSTTTPASQDVSGGISPVIASEAKQTGIGNTGADADTGGAPSLPSPSSAGSQIGSTQVAAARAGMSDAQYRQKLKAYYVPLMQLQAINGNTEALQRTRDEATAMMGQNFGAASLAEAFHFQRIYNDLKGEAANNFASQLENHVSAGNRLTDPQAMFMTRWANAAAPLTRDSSGAFVRGNIPVSPAMMTELQRNGINLQGFPAPGVAGAPAGAPGTAAGPGAPQWSTLDAPLTPTQTAAQEDAARENIMKTDPTFAHALASNQAAEAGISSLSVPNENPGAPAAHRAGMAMYIKTMLDNARVSGQSQEQIDDLTSRLQQMRDQWEKMFNTGGTLPPETRKSMAQQMFINARIGAHPYNSYWGEGSEAAQNMRARGLNPARAIPAAPSLSPEIIRWATVPEAGQPAPGVQSAPAANAPVSAVPTSDPYGNIRRRLGIGQ